MLDDEILKAVDTWQNASFFHEMTCGKDSRHAPLRARKNASGKVVLYCPDCDYVQEEIPQLILASYKNGFYEKMKKFLEDLKTGEMSESV